MGKVAKSDANEIVIGSEVFRFDDGTRQVTEKEAQLLREYDGPAKVEIVEDRKTKDEGSK